MIYYDISLRLGLNFFIYNVDLVGSKPVAIKVLPLLVPTLAAGREQLDDQQVSKHGPLELYE